MSQINSIGGGGGGVGTGILTINDITPDTDNNFTLESTNGITLGVLSHGLTIGNTEGASKFVVDSQGNAGYTTIQSAITAAALVATSTVPQTVWIWPGTYTETLTLHDYVHLASANATGVYVVGNVTYTAVASNAFLSLKGIVITTPAGGGAAFTLAGSALCHVFLNNCTFNGTTGTSFVSTNTNGDTEIFHQNCVFSASSSRKIFSVSGGSGIYIRCFGCYLISSNTASTITNDSYLYFLGSYINDSYVVSSANTILWVEGSQCKGAGNLPFVNCSVQFSNAVIFDSTVSCHNTYWATGPGTLFYGNVTSFGNALDGTGSLGSAIDPTMGGLGGFPCQLTSISFDGNATAALNTVTQGTIHQVLLGTGTSAVSVVSGTGTTGQILTSNGTGADPTWEDSSGGSGTQGVSPYVVDSQGRDESGYTTIQAAITAAALVATSTTPQTIWIWPGTYTETVSIPDYVYLSAALPNSVFIIGNTTFTTSHANAKAGISNIVFTTPEGGGAAFTIASSSGAGNASFIIQNCVFNATTGNGLASTDAQAAVGLYVFSCLFNTSSGHRSLNFTNNGISYIQDCTFQSTNTPSFLGATLAIFISATGNESFQIANSSPIFMKHCFLQAVGSGAQFQIASGCELDIAFCDLNCSDGGGFWASGYNPGSGTTYGNIKYSAISPSAGSAIKIDPLLTVGSYTLEVANLSFDANTSTASNLNTATQGTVNQVLLGTGTSAINTVSGTGTSGQVLTSNGSGSDPTWQVSTPDAFDIANILPADSPYGIDYTKNYLSCDTSTGPITLILPDSVAFSAILYIKDAGGQSSVHNITITTISGLIPIDGDFTIVLDDDYNSVNLVWNTDHYEVF